MVSVWVPTSKARIIFFWDVKEPFQIWQPRTESSRAFHRGRPLPSKATHSYKNLTRMLFEPQKNPESRLHQFSHGWPGCASSSKVSRNLLLLLFHVICYISYVDRCVYRILSLLFIMIFVIYMYGMKIVTWYCVLVYYLVVHLDTQTHSTHCIQSIKTAQEQTSRYGCPEPK